ncbi:hypothetical protein [Aquirufa nivalisilvae]
MKPEKGQLNIFFDKDIVTTAESQQILTIVNTAIGLATIDIIEKENKSKYESLKFSYYGYLYHRNQEFANSVFESFFPYDKFDDDHFYHRLRKLRAKIKEPYLEEIYFLLDELYHIRRPRNYARRELQSRVISELAENRSFENRNFNIQDFSDWLNSESENNVSEIGLATTENSLEYEIKFLLIWGLKEYDYLKDITLLAFDYLLSIFNKPRQDKPTLTVPDLPNNLAKTIKNFDKVDIDVDVENGTMKLKLRKRK